MTNSELGVRAVAEPVRSFVIRAACIVVPAGTVRFPLAWAYVTVALVAEAATRLYLVRRDPTVAERRQHANAKSEDRSAQRSARGWMNALSFVSLVVCGLDHRYGWSDAPAAVNALGLVLVGVGLFVVFLAVRANGFASVLVRLHDEQAVVSSGPYGLVRHPMYSGIALFMIGTPLALGSWWGLLVGACLASTLVARLIDEERFLADSLSGYREYTEQVRHRLVPLVW